MFPERSHHFCIRIAHQQKGNKDSNYRCCSVISCSHSELIPFRSCRGAGLHQEENSDSDAEEGHNVECHLLFPAQGALLELQVSCLCVVCYTDLFLCFCQTLTCCCGKAAVGRSNKKNYPNTCLRVACTRTASIGGSP